MKTIFCVAGMMIFSVLAWGQPNNPNDRNGADYFKSVSMVVEDIAQRDLGSLTDETIRAYAAKVPFACEASLELATKVYKTFNEPGIDLKNLLASSSLSDGFKKYAYQVIMPEPAGDQTISEYLVKMTDEVLQSELDRGEKDFMLSVIAIRYHSEQTGQSGRGRRCNMYVNGVPVASMSAEACITTAVVVGGIIGFSYCSWPCAIGGAIIGGVVAVVHTMS